MIIYFYKSTANPDKLDKTGFLTQIGTAETIKQTHRIDMLTPTISVNYDAALLDANYVYIPDFKRYYFCKISTDTGLKMILNCEVDVLYSWAAAIAAAPCTAVRSESAGVNYVPDNKLPVDSSRFNTQGIPFPNSIENRSLTDNRHYIIVLNNVGGVTNGG